MLRVPLSVLRATI